MNSEHGYEDSWKEVRKSRTTVTSGTEGKNKSWRTTKEAGKVEEGKNSTLALEGKEKALNYWSLPKE